MTLGEMTLATQKLALGSANSVRELWPQQKGHHATVRSYFWREYCSAGRF